MRRLVPEQLRQRAGDESGFSVLEVSIASAMLVAIMAIVLPFLIGSFDVLAAQESRSQTVDQLQLAMQRIERDVRSGNVIGEPTALGGVDGMEVRLYTQVYGAPFICVHYRVSSGQLQRREREPDEAWPTTWGVVADGITNATATPPVPVFARSTDRQTLVIDLRVNRAQEESGFIRATSSITGRNTKAYDTPFTGDTCQ